jgi:hypothetical protein
MKEIIHKLPLGVDVTTTVHSDCVTVHIDATNVQVSLTLSHEDARAWARDVLAAIEESE